MIANDTITDKLCAECSDKHWDRWNNFNKHNPGATIDQWAGYWEKDYQWQLKTIDRCCYVNKYSEIVNQAVMMGDNLPKATDADWPLFNKE